jgi:hypothetical protein
MPLPYMSAEKLLLTAKQDEELHPGRGAISGAD